MKQDFLTYWLRWTYLNLVIVAVIGLLMRLKVVFELPWINQKNLQLAHAQFAFQGWISQLLLVLLVFQLGKSITEKDSRFFHRWLGWHQVLNMALLVIVLFQGMGPVTFLGPLVIFAVQALLFGRIYWLYRQNQAAMRWLNWGIIFAGVSWLSVLLLGLWWFTGKMNIQSYLGFHYTFLHFQYNGWFFFSAMALLIKQWELDTPKLSFYRSLLVITGFTGLLLSLLWLKLPLWLQVVAGVSGLLQLWAWIGLVMQFKKEEIWAKSGKLGWLIGVIAFAWTIKQILQPALLFDTFAEWAYGFRPVIIAYLHLILLGVYSLFLIYFSRLSTGKFNGYAPLGFVLAVAANELLLAWHGLLSINYTGSNWIDGALLGAAVMLSITAIWLWRDNFNPVSAA